MQGLRHAYEWTRDRAKRAVAWLRAHKVARRAAFAGSVLALTCHFLPPHYRAVCEAVATVCTGGSP